MPTYERKALLTALQEKQKGLDLILAIDDIRDSRIDPATMLTAIARELADRFRAELCLICLRNRETGEIELKAIDDGNHYPIQPGNIRALAEEALDSDDVTVWEGDTARSVMRLEPIWAGDASEAADRPQVAAVPIRLNANERLGALLLARSHLPFGADDLALLRLVETQIDSAVMQVFAHQDLQQRTQELEVIYRIDRIRDQQLSFDEMLSTVLQELCDVMGAGIGFVLLYNRAGKRLELRAVTPEDLFREFSQHPIVKQAANEALQHAKLVCHNGLEGELHSVMCVPLILHNEIIGVLGVANRYTSSGFDAKERRLLSAIASQMDTAIFESLERRRLRQVLGRSVDPRVMERLLQNADIGFLKGERMVLTVLYADMRGSTSLAEHTAPELLVGFINEYLGRMTDVIFDNEGTLDKFVGDEVMALFGAPFPQADHALRAVRVGLEMQIVHQRVMEEWSQRSIDPAPIGVGIATGEMTVGEMGSSQRTDYTVIGRAANLGARLCSAAKAGQVLISQATYDLVKDQVEAVPITGLQLKGVTQDVCAHHVLRVL